MSWTGVNGNKLVDKMFNYYRILFQITFFLKFGVSTYYFLILFCIFSKRLNSHVAFSFPSFTVYVAQLLQSLHKEIRSF